MEERLKSLLPVEWLVEPIQFGDFRWVASTKDWSIVYDIANKQFLFSYKRLVTQWTSCSLLNMHVRLVMLPESNERFLKSLPNRKFFSPCQ